MNLVSMYNLIDKKAQRLLDYIERLNIRLKTSNDTCNYLRNTIDKAIEYMEHYIEVEDAPINERIKIEFEYVLDILKGEDNGNI